MGSWQALKVALAETVLLGVISLPCVMLLISVMAPGYAKHNRLLGLMGSLLIPLFIFNYYDDSSLTLLATSGVLVISGAILIAGRTYLAVKKLNREAV